MERIASCEKIIDQVDLWFTKNASEIERLMRGFYDRVLNLSDGVWTADELSNRALSERPICWSLPDIARVVPLPDFKLLMPDRGWIKLAYPALGEPGCDGVGHGFFFEGKSKVIACFTFGQYILPYATDCRAWDRIYFAVNLAPDLIKISGGVALLRGRADDIYERLGLGYGPRDRSGEF